MKFHAIVLTLGIAIFTSCNTVKVINTETEPVPVKVTSQPIQTTITNDLSSVKVNNTDAQPIPVKVTNPSNGNNVENRIYFRVLVKASSNKVPFVIEPADLVSGTLPEKPYNYFITTVFGSSSSQDVSFFAKGISYTLFCPVNTLTMLPFNTSENTTISVVNGVYVVGYIVK